MKSHTLDSIPTKQKENSGDIKNRIGYTGPGKYYLPQWTVKDIEEISKLMFDDFSADDFHRYCEELAKYFHMAALI